MYKSQFGQQILLTKLTFVFVLKFLCRQNKLHLFLNSNNSIMSQENQQLLRPHQLDAITRILNPNQRGLLLNHALGSGKTRTALEAAARLITSHEYDGVLVLLPATLRHNMQKEIKKWVPQLKDKFKFVNYNSPGNKVKTPKGGKSGMFEQLGKMGYGLINDQAARTAFPYIYNKYPNVQLLENLVIIIDEIHLLSRSSTSGPDRAFWWLSQLVERSPSCKVIGLTGTPVVNHPVEISYTFNMISGKTLLPTDFAEFHERYVDMSLGNYDTYRMQNMESIKDLIRPYVSYYQPSVDDSTLPRLSEHECDVVVSGFACDAISESFATERSARCFSRGSVAHGVFEKNMQYNGAIFMSRSQQQSNYVFPQDVYRFSPGKKTNQVWEYMDPKAVFEFNGTTPSDVLQSVDRCIPAVIPEKIRQQTNLEKLRLQLTIWLRETYSVEDILESGVLSARDKRIIPSYENNMNYSMRLLKEGQDKYMSDESLRELSPKMLQMIDNMRTRLDEDDSGLEDDDEPNPCKRSKSTPSWVKGPIVIYSRFVRYEGVGVMKLALNVRGFSEFDHKSKSPVLKPGLRYVTLSSDLTCEQKRAILDVFNSDANINGDMIKVLFLTQSATEGVSLRHVRQLHMMNPEWDIATEKQVVGRAVRMDSHVDLPDIDRHVDVYRYFTNQMIRKQDEDGTEKEEMEPFSDKLIEKIAKRKQRMIDEVCHMIRTTEIIVIE